MKKTLRYFFTAVLLQASSAISPGQGTPPVSDYHLRVRIDPSSSRLECTTKILNPIDSCFFLNKDMEIRRIIADGKLVLFRHQPADNLPGTNEITIQSRAHSSLEIEYAGPIKAESFPSIVSNANLISPDLVELAIYVSWYPRMKSGGTFNFRLDADLPADFVTVTNGSLIKGKVENNRNLTTWESYSPCFDIALLAAPHLHKTAVHRNGVTAEIYYDKLPKTYVDSMKTNLLRSMEWLSKLLGSPKSARLIRVAYSPRQTWGYVRTPFIIVSEGSALSWRSQIFGQARDFRYLTHEIAHYWWGFAAASTPDDWINEGLAEYSAFLASRDIVGKSFTETLLSEYRQRAAQSKTKTAIAETESNSPDREVNRYDKPTLLFDYASRKFGADRMNRFLKSLYNRCASGENVTTPLLLDEMGKKLGKKAKDFFSAALYNRDWKTVVLE